MPPTAPVTRKPRSPEDSRNEILQAARDLLRERPFRELSVNTVMERTGLKRPSFYVHFKDRHDIVLHVFASIADDLYAASEGWFEDRSDPIESVRAALERIVEIYVEQGPVLKAIGDAAADDATIDEAYHRVIDHFIASATEHIRQDQQAGHALGTDAPAVSRVLVWTIERYLSEMLGRDPQADPRALVDTLHTIWVRSIYGTTPSY